MGRLSRRFPVYSRLLRLYPAAYYREYHQEIMQTLADMLDSAPSRSSRAHIWLRTAIDLPASATAQHITTIGGTMTHAMPVYIKRNALIGAAMLLPFVGLIASGALQRPQLADARAWKPVLYAAIFILPLIAFLLNAVSALRWSANAHAQSGVSYGRALLRVQYIWPALITAAAGLGIAALVYGHDTAHCVVGNPIRIVRNTPQTWQCIQDS
jgi:hypothetical protein